MCSYLMTRIGWLSLLAAAPLAATPTTVTVRVLSQGAKFVGTSLGGALVTIKDADTGELLASGRTAGTTGDTERIMKQRPSTLATADAAKFVATLDLEAPRYVEIAAYGPLANRQAANRAAVTQWLLPGKDIAAGDAVLLVLRGFLVDVLGPPAHIKLSGPQKIRLAANVTMMCGCPVQPGGLWDPEGYQIRAIITKDGKKLGERPLAYAGKPSQFETTIEAAEPGVYEAAVYAFDPANGNTGLDRTTWIVLP